MNEEIESPVGLSAEEVEDSGTHVDLGKVEVPVEAPATPSLAVATPPNPFWKSPRFWFIGICSFSTVLMRPDFASLPWNVILGQFLAIWMAGAASVGLVDRVTDKFSA